VLRHYACLEEDNLRRSAKAGPAGPVAGVTAAQALNSEVAAYTPLVLHVLRALRAFSIDQVRGWVGGGLCVRGWVGVCVRVCVCACVCVCAWPCTRWSSAPTC
jgi:hypothetical protein